MKVAGKKILKLITFKLLLTTALFIASVFVFAFIADEAVLENEPAFDNAVFNFFSSISSPAFIAMMKVLTFFGSKQFILPAYIILVGYFFLKKKFRYGIDIAIVALTSFVLSYTLKNIFHRTRPSLPGTGGITTYSFPSGHTLSAFIFCSILVFMVFHNNWKPFYKYIVSILLFLFALMVGISRIALRAHYPTDVIASLLLGTAWVILSLWLMQMLNRKYAVRKDLKQA